MNEKAPFPHCDPKVLHAPGKCEYCDEYPAMQEERKLDGVNFTGEHDPALKPCPALDARSLDTIEKWSGNVAKPPKKHKTEGWTPTQGAYKFYPQYINFRQTDDGKNIVVTVRGPETSDGRCGECVSIEVPIWRFMTMSDGVL